MSKAKQVIQWVKNNKVRGKGISAFDNESRSYPEVTGYLIPTLLNYRQGTFVKTLINYLVELVDDEGGVPGFDQITRVFDTSAVLEGLYALQYSSIPSSTKPIEDAIKKIEKFLDGMYNSNGFYYTSIVSDEPQFYNLRASGIYGDRKTATYWKDVDPLDLVGEMRTHYLAYGIEGLVELGWYDQAKDMIERIMKTKTNGLLPYTIKPGYHPGRDNDICATAQLAYIGHWFDFDVEDMVEAVRNQVMLSGGVPLATNDLRSASWSAKFYLDMEYELKNPRKLK